MRNLLNFMKSGFILERMPGMCMQGDTAVRVRVLMQTTMD
jgi:hypothetical protein